MSAEAGLAADVRTATAAVRARMAARTPRIALVLGSGVGFLAERVTDGVRIGYADIPGFPLPTVEGHGGELVIGTLAGQSVIAQSGRFHMDEGHSAAVSSLAVRVFG